MAGLFRSLSRRNSTSSQKSSTSAGGRPPFSVPLDINDRPILAGKPTLVVAASTPEFDNVQLQQWRDEGYQVHYEYVHGRSRSATFGVQRIGDGLEEGQTYAIVPYPNPTTLRHSC